MHSTVVKEIELVEVVTLNVSLPIQVFVVNGRVIALTNPTILEAQIAYDALSSQAKLSARTSYMNDQQVDSHDSSI